jgi:hypothetical protein
VLSTQGANTFRNPGYFNVNAGVAKSFTRFRGLREAKPPSSPCAETFINLLNRTNWGPIDNDVAEGNNFGFSTTTYNKRFLQLGASLRVLIRKRNSTLQGGAAFAGRAALSTYGGRAWNRPDGTACKCAVGVLDFAVRATLALGLPRCVVFS